MKTFTELLNDAATLSGEIRELENQQRKIVEEYSTTVADLRAGVTHRAEKRSEKLEKIKAIEDRLKTAQIKLKLTRSNAKMALYTQVMPIILDILKRYEGKPYGEKTKQKISDEVKLATEGRCRMYISTNYTYSEMNIYTDMHDNYYDIDVYGKYTQNGGRIKLLIDNKIQALSLNELQPDFESKYVEDVEAQAEKILKAYDTVYAAAQELERVCGAFNELICGEIKRIRPTDHIYSEMRV